MINYKVEFSNMPWEIIQSGARHKIFQQGNRKLRLVEFTDQFVEQNWCTVRHFGMVLEGELIIDFNGELVHYSKGDGIFIPGGESSKHKARVSSGKARLLLVDNV